MLSSTWLQDVDKAIYSTECEYFIIANESLVLKIQRLDWKEMSKTIGEFYVHPRPLRIDI